MRTELSILATRIRAFIRICIDDLAHLDAPSQAQLAAHAAAEFNGIALLLFTLQFKHNPAYRMFCEARGVTPDKVADWAEIPAIPTAAFKELDLTALAAAERRGVFYSSGTTEQRPSRHFHSEESLAVYEDSLWAWFNFCIGGGVPVLSLTPPSGQVPNSSLVHMFDVIQRRSVAASYFLGSVDANGGWQLERELTLAALGNACELGRPVQVVGTAFSFVHLADLLAENGPTFPLPAGSIVLETGGYKGRSRSMPKPELHALITARLGVAAENIICEYGMSELSSQAYDTCVRNQMAARSFRFPPWTRVQIISPETGQLAADGETGLVRIFDLANVFSVFALQTSDLAVRRGAGFELIGRAELAEPRGCSLMAV